VQINNAALREVSTSLWLHSVTQSASFRDVQTALQRVERGAPVPLPTGRRPDIALVFTY
jgi:hypothetical protein